MVVKKSRFIKHQHLLDTSRKMNEIVNNVLLAGDKFMPEMYLKQPGFTYSACGLFTKKKENSKT